MRPPRNSGAPFSSTITTGVTCAFSVKPELRWFRPGVRGRTGTVTRFAALPPPQRNDRATRLGLTGRGRDRCAAIFSSAASDWTQRRRSIRQTWPSPLPWRPSIVTPASPPPHHFLVAAARLVAFLGGHKCSRQNPSPFSRCDNRSSFGFPLGPVSSFPSLNGAQNRDAFASLYPVLSSFRSADSAAGIFPK
ncbi:hypothetical protein HPB51_025717 [Rhipicephalus microplus]|uniref:Uncharacterized protein n=1 Tax=Rhipicephalus microplus TaxID=6941 RepID=A0A9J6EJR5_RHIMP|nr:hypothetical protein HPB51_025717 [Rhipicephalus microplus]